MLSLRIIPYVLRFICSFSCFYLILYFLQFATVESGFIDPNHEAANGVINGAINEVINGVINLNENEQKVFIAITENPHVTKSKLIASLGISKGTVDRAIKSLKEKGAIERIGSNKTGYWKIQIPAS